MKPIAEELSSAYSVLSMTPLENWAVPLEELYDPYQNPSHLSLGQLTDDLEEMGRIADQETPIVSLDFVKMSAVLAAIGHKTVW